MRVIGLDSSMSKYQQGLIVPAEPDSAASVSLISKGFVVWRSWDRAASFG